MNILYTVIIYPITQLIEFVFTFSQTVFKETGISIIVISIVVNIICLPLYNLAEKWQETERKTHKKLKPKMDNIKAAFSGDERFMIMQTFYRQNHYHPVYALRSSFGLLIQIPFFIAAYSYLSNLPAIKGTSFLFIPDLGEPDRLFTYLGINLLPLIMTAINLISGAIYTRGFPLKDKIQLYGMAALFLLLLYNSVSGLVIYWTMNNLFSVIKNLFYKLPLKNKKNAAAILFSASCFFLSFYLRNFFNGSIHYRGILSATLLIVGFLPWLLFILKKIILIHKINLIPQLSFKPNSYIFIFSLLSLWFLAGIFLPSMLIVASPQEFSFIDNYTTPLYFILNTGLQAAGLFIVWPVFIFCIFDDKIKGKFTFFVPMVLLISLVNVFVFPGDYGLISLELVFDSRVKHYAWDILLNLFVLCVPVFIIYFLNRINQLKILFTAIFLSLVSMSLYSAFNLYKINSEFLKVREFHSEPIKDIDKIEPFIHLSKTGKNTVVIMLDRAISVFFPFILEEDPELKEVYSGFTYYPNTVSFNGYTSMGAPPLFGGYEYTPFEINRRDDVSLVTKHNESLLLMPQIFSEAGYSVTVTDPPYSNYASKDDLRIYNSYSNVKALITDSKYTNLWMKEHNMSFPSTGSILKRDILWYSLFKISPLALRQGIYFDGDWCAPSRTQKMTLTLNGYSVLDYLREFTDFQPDKENTALIMVNNTTHEPSFLQPPDYRPVMTVTNHGENPFNREPAYHVNIASVKRIGEWLTFLKTENVYNNTRFIFVSDHGAEPNFLIKSSLPFNIEQFNPLLMVKDFDESGPIKTDWTFMSNADVPFLALNGQIENPVNPFTGKKITPDVKANPLYIAVSGSIHLGDPNAKSYILNKEGDYYVHTNLFESYNWEKAENY